MHQMEQHDAATLATLLDRALAYYNVDAGTTRALAFAELLAQALPKTGPELYWCARIAMLPSIGDLTRFHAAFIDFWGALPQGDILAALVPNVPRDDVIRNLQRASPRMRAPAPDERRAGDAEARDAALFVAMASPEERLVDRDFAEMDERELALARRAVARLASIAETRRSRLRRTAVRGDRLDLRATLRNAARTAGELLRRRNSERRERLRPLVFLCDVSGSMVPYARPLLQYARYSALQRSRVRAFAFATRLTEIGPTLMRAGPTRAMGALGRELRDYGGGTRIGAALHAFNARYAQRGAARGGTVVILSDGWEREDPELVAREMARLQKLCRRIVWVNPQKKHPAFEPLARGMAAALPYVDALVAGHNLRSLEAIAGAVEAGGRGAVSGHRAKGSRPMETFERKPRR
jgi:uncharacterized protein with von Willebrand factor type A (vWA) domain